MSRVSLLAFFCALLGCQPSPLEALDQAIDQCRSTGQQCLLAARLACDQGETGSQRIAAAVPHVATAQPALRGLVFDHARCAATASVDPVLVQRVAATLTNADGRTRHGQLSVFEWPMRLAVWARARQDGVPLMPPAAPASLTEDVRQRWCSDVPPMVLSDVQAPKAEAYRLAGSLLRVDCGSQTDAVVQTVFAWLYRAEAAAEKGDRPLTTDAFRTVRAMKAPMARATLIGEWLYVSRKAARAWRWWAQIWRPQFTCMIGHDVLVHLDARFASPRWPMADRKALVDGMINWVRRCPAHAISARNILGKAGRALHPQAAPMLEAVGAAKAHCSWATAQRAFIRNHLPEATRAQALAALAQRCP